MTHGILSRDKDYYTDFPSSPMVWTSPSNSAGVSWIPGQGAKISHASWPKNKTEAIL